MSHVIRLAAVPLLLVSFSGCLIVDVGVTNPVRGLRTVAVLPFFNQSDERSVNGRLLASHYASELQKTPGVEVIPVGVVETTMRQYGMDDVSGPADAARLALLLHADAVVIGTVTEYSPYSPPRLGLSIAWYTPYSQQFDPGVPTEPQARRRVHRDLMERRKARFRNEKQRIVKGVERRLDRFFLSNPGKEACPDGNCPPQKTGPAKKQRPPPSSRAKRSPLPPVKIIPPPVLVPAQPFVPPKPQGKAASKFLPPIIVRGQSQSAPVERNRRLRISPLMTYTKVFDASDAATAAAFRDYLELRDDGRQGSWTARLQWADEFSRFVSHMMIVEMFQLHGGEARRRLVWKWRKYK